MMNVTKENIKTMLPHAGNMVLLDEVTQWDEHQIQCRARSHLDPKNPLRFDNKLTSLAGIEYAGQAIALHRYLLQQDKTTKPKQGYLAALKQVEFAVTEIPNSDSPLIISANCTYTDGNKAIYDFSITTENQQLIHGSMVVAEEV